MKPRYFVWSPRGRVPSFEHPTAQNAKIEAERLARLNPGEKFMVLQSIAECEKVDVTWREHQPDFQESDIPF